MPAQNQESPANDVVRFGAFEADLQAGELRKSGRKLKLQDLPFRLLAALLERPGELVTSKELQAKLWPGGTFVDFEAGIATALNKVREALGDSASNPRFIETVPRRGFRFIAEIEREEIPETGTPGPQEAEAPAAWAPKRRVVAFIAAAVVVVLVCGGAYSRFRAQRNLLTDQDILVLADFTNTTGDTAFDGALRQALAFDLEESPFLKVMDDEEVDETLKLMGHPIGEKITNDVAHEVCLRDGQKATIGGAIASLGKTYVITLQAINCQTGATLAREKVEAEGKEHVISAVATAARGMRAKLGESLSTIQKPEWHSAYEVTTHSLEALKAYQVGFTLLARDSPREAIPQFQVAIQMDSSFAQAYDMLSIGYRNSGQSALANEPLSKAFALLDHVSERERLYISGHYYQWVKGDLDKAFDAYQVAARTYPWFAPPHRGLYMVYVRRGEYEKALEQDREALRLEPRNAAFISNLIDLYVDLDRVDEAKAITLNALAQQPDQRQLHGTRLYIAYLQNDRSAQEKEIEWFAGGPDEYRSLARQATDALVHGQRRKAKELFQRAGEFARRQGVTDPYGSPPALIDAWMGDCNLARKEKVAGALVICGDPSAVKARQELFLKNPPANPDTVDLLYLRGEFQKILDHKGRSWGPYYPLAYLGLARAASKAADIPKAKRAYQDFLELWKDADKDAPNLKEATAELAELH